MGPPHVHGPWPDRAVNMKNMVIFAEFGNYARMFFLHSGFGFIARAFKGLPQDFEKIVFAGINRSFHRCRQMKDDFLRHVFAFTPLGCLCFTQVCRDVKNSRAFRYYRSHHIEKKETNFG